MKTHDVNGREYARLSTVMPGDRLEVDDGFTCMKKGDVKIVYADDEDKLYIHCDGPEDTAPADGEIGRHYLDGQQDNDCDSLIGLYRVT